MSAENGKAQPAIDPGYCSYGDKHKFNHSIGNLTLKSKGLLSMMLSLRDDWNYTTQGLAAISKEGVDAIGTALKELEIAGYIGDFEAKTQSVYHSALLRL